MALNSKSLPEQAVEKVKQYISDHGLVAGDKMPNEFQMAEICEVGRSTIREAIKILTFEGIVEVVRGSGTFIAEPPNQSDLIERMADPDPIGLQNTEKHIALRALEFLDARLIIEPEVAAMAADHATYHECQKMIEASDEVEECIHRKVDHLDADIKFHTFIAQGAHNNVVRNMTELLVKGIPVFIEVTHNFNTTQTIESHRAIVNAIISGDARGARCAMITHLNINRQLIMNAVEKEKSNRGEMSDVFEKLHKK